MTDNRLLDCDTKAKTEANFLRILALIDTVNEAAVALEERVAALEPDDETETT